MEFFDNFEDFDCEQSSSQATKQYPSFSPCLQNPNWFLNNPNSELESEFFCAVSMFDQGLYLNSLKIFEKVHQTTKNNRFHEITLLDSMLQCYIKIDQLNFSESKCFELLTSFENLLVDFGDQIQFLRTKAEVLTRFTSDSDLLDTVSLLCSLSDLPENWYFFLGLSDNEKFRLCIHIKCLMSYESQINLSHGFVRDAITKKMETIQKYIVHAADPEMIQKIRKEMSFNQKVTDEENHQKDFKAHDCRAKNRFVSDAEKTEILSNFKSRYSFLFSFLE